MRLADFIESSLGEILKEWVAFAATRVPSASRMDQLALQDHSSEILAAICADLRQPQSEAAQAAKAHGLAPIVHGVPETAAEVHGMLRARDGFSMTQLVSEYRALRASVMKLWSKSAGSLFETTAPEDMVRFNEAIDQAIAESVDYFSRELAQERTDHAAAEQALIRNSARLEYATRLSRVGFWYCDLPFDVLEWDDRVKEHFFFEPTATVTIEDFYDRIHPEDREPTRVAIATSISSRQAYDIVYRTQHPTSGQVKWIRALGGTNYASDGSPVHFDGITVDVSAQKLADERLAESEAHHRGVLSNMEEGFTLFDREFTIIEINDAACRLVGLPRTELLGTNHWKRFPGTHDSELGKAYREVLSDGQPRSVENQYLFADGREVWFEVRAFAVGPGVAVLFRDVTERQKMIKTLKEADRRKDEFLAMLAHELRNPLAPITSAGEILARISEPDPKLEKATAVIRRQVKHLTRLVDDLLDVSRVTRGQIQLQRAPVDVGSVISQSVETCHSQLQAKGHRLTVSTTASTPLFVDGDSARLVQCVGNILANAAKYTEPNGDIHVTARAEASQVVIEVTDSGTGIGPELLPHVFDLFVQSRRTLDRSEGGLGIGLAVVKRLIEMHGGQVHALSKGEGLGSTFAIRLPLISAPITTTENIESSSYAARRVIVVDDNVDAAESIVALLSYQGHTAMAVYDAREALRVVETFRPEVMLIDIGLPDIDGHELTRQLNKQPACRGVLKVALTGYGQPEDRQRALDAGFDEHLVKPVDLSTLERVIAKLSNHR